MPTTIDDLEIKIQSSAEDASKDLDRLANSMIKLASSMSINVGKMSGVAIGLNSITKASQGMNSRNISTLATALNKVAGVDSGSISRVAGSVTQLKNSMSGGFTADVSGIANVATALSKLGGVKTTQGTQTLLQMKDQLIQFVNGMNQVGSFNFDASGLNNTISAIAKLGGKNATQAVSNLPTISAQLQNFVRQMNQIGSMSFDNANLTELVTSIGKLGSVASGRAVSNIPLLATNLKNLFQTLSTAPNVSQNIVEMTNALARLAQTGAASGTAARSLSGNLLSFSNSSGKAKKSAFSLASAFGKLYASYWLVIRGFGQLKNAMEISSSLTEVENVVRTTFADAESKVTELAKTSIEQLGMSELALKQYASTFQAMGASIGISSKQVEKANSYLNTVTGGYVGLSDSLADVSLNMTKLTADIASFYDKDQADVAEDLQSIYTGMVVPLRKYGLDLTQATLKEWALKNGLDADISSMTQAEKAMLRYQYVMANTVAAQGDFADTSQTWANQIRILKQNFQQLATVIGGAFVNAFKPFVQTMNAVMKKVIAFATTVTNALGAIFGWKYEVSGGGVADDWSDAASSADNLADSTGKAADNTKKMKSYLLGIDELNVLEPDDSDSGSGSGSGGSGSGGGAGGASGGLVKTDTIWKDFESDIKNLYELGEYIGDTLSKMMESIDWDGVYEKARNFGKGLADFLNGLISPRLFGNVGKTIAGALNTALEFLNSFGTTFDWKDFGESIAAGINKFFSTYNFKLLATTLNTWVRGIETTIVTALKNINWSDIFDGISEFVTNLNLDTAILLIIASIKKLTPQLDKLGKGFNALVKYGSALVGTFGNNAVSIAVLSAKFPNLSNVIVTTTNTFAAFKDATGSTMTAVLGAAESGAMAIRNCLSAFQKLAIGIAAVAGEFIFVKDGFYDIASGSDNLIASLGQVAVAAGVASAALYVAFGPAGLVVAAITGVVAAIAGIKSSLEDAELDTVFTALESSGTVSLENLGDVAKSTFSEITSDAMSTKESLNSIAETRESINETVENVGKLKTAIEAGAYSTGEKTQDVIQQYQNLLTSSKDVFNEEYDVIVGNVVGAWADVLTAQGQSVPLLVAQLAAARDAGNEAFTGMSADLENLVSQFNSGAISEQEFLEQATPIIEKLSNANSDGAIDETANSIKNFGGAMDISQYISNGELDIEAFRAAIGDVTTTAQTGKDNLATIGEESQASIQAMKERLEALGVDTSSIDWASMYGASEEQVQSGINSINEAYTEYANQVQYNLLEQLPSVVDQATADYENLGLWQKMFTTKEEYVNDAIGTWKDSVLTPATTALQDGFDELGIDGETFADDAATKMVSGLFDTVVTATENDGQKASQSLKDNWQSILNNALDGASKAINAEDYGKNMVEGFSNGVNKNTKSATDQVTDLMNAIDTAIHDSALQFGSPSLRAEEYGGWFIEGFNNGIINNTQSSIDTINTWIATLAESFTDETWAPMFSGLLTGFQTTWTEVTLWWTETAMPEFFTSSVGPWFTQAFWNTKANGMKLGLQQKWTEFVTWWKANINTWFTLNVMPWFTVERWTEQGEHFRKALKDKWDEFATQWHKDLTNWWNSDVTVWFTVSKWNDFGTNMKNGLYTGFKGIVQMIGSVMNGMIDVFNNGLSRIASAMNSLISDFNSVAGRLGVASLPHVGASSISKVSIPAFEVGGFPEDGLFFANHNEMVGQFSNGKTAVANNEQIVAGIMEGVKSAVTEALAPYLSEIADNTRETAEKDTSINVDGRELVTAINNRISRNGFSFT